MQLREYQLRLVRQIQVAYQTHRSVCLQLQTGAGKTAVAAHICDLMYKKHGKRKGGLMLFIVHRRELLWQIASTLRNFGLENDYGFIASGISETPWAPIQIASIQTIVRRLDKTNINPLMVCIDEFHHAPADTYVRVKQRFPNAFYLGLTATPIRKDGKGLKPMASGLIKGPSPKKLISQGWLAPIDTYSIPSEMQMADVPLIAGDYSRKATDSKITHTVIASSLRNWVKFAKNKRTIHYAVSRRHSKEFVAQAKEAGYVAEHVDGTMNKHVRDGIIRRFKFGQTTIISNCEIISEGFDVPETECVILGRPTKSLVVYLQQIGRVMRPKKDGAHGIVLDVAGNYNQFGNAEDEREWVLEDGLGNITDEERKSPKKHRICSCGIVYPKHLDQCPECQKYSTKSVAQLDFEVVPVHEIKIKKPKPKVGKKQLMREVFSTNGDIRLLTDLCNKYSYNQRVIPFWKGMITNRASR